MEKIFQRDEVIKLCRIYFKKLVKLIKYNSEQEHLCWCKLQKVVSTCPGACADLCADNKVQPVPQTLQIKSLKDLSTDSIALLNYKDIKAISKDSLLLLKHAG